EIKALKDSIGGKKKELEASRLVSNYLKYANSLFVAGKLQDSLSEADKALAIYPDNVEAKALVQRIQARIEQKKQEYAGLLSKSRAALARNDFSSARRYLRKAMTLNPETTETKQLLLDIERTQAATKRMQHLQELESAIGLALKKQDIRAAREALDSLKQAKPGKQVITDFESKIDSREKELKRQALFDKSFQQAKSLHAQGRLIEALGVVEDALQILPENDEAQSLLHGIQAEKKRKLAKLTLVIVNALSIDDVSKAEKALDELKSYAAGAAEIKALKDSIGGKKKELEASRLVSNYLKYANSLFVAGKLQDSLSEAD
ncbi:MAG: hypothetical protein GY801_13265, partial [bacterium]|nr:hypothetical protein [bacterium]